MDRVLNISKAVWSQILPWGHVVKITQHGYEKQVRSCSSLESMETNDEKANVTYSGMDFYSSSRPVPSCTQSEVPATPA